MTSNLLWNALFAWIQNIHHAKAECIHAHTNVYNIFWRISNTLNLIDRTSQILVDNVLFKEQQQFSGSNVHIHTWYAFIHIRGWWKTLCAWKSPAPPYYKCVSIIILICTTYISATMLRMWWALNAKVNFQEQEGKNNCFLLTACVKCLHCKEC